MTKKVSLGGPLTRPECDKCLDTLALALPRAGISRTDAHDMLDLYFSLLNRAGVTGKMLISACQRYIMAPNDGKAKFFPDPGQLAELCAPDIRARHLDLESLDKAMALLDAPPPTDEAQAPNLRASLHTIGENLAALKPPPPPLPNTARSETDAGELRAALQKRMGAA